MRRKILGGIVALALSTAVIVHATQQTVPPPGALLGGQSDVPPVGTPQKVADNLYLLTGQGGNTVVFIASTGVVLVDTKLVNNGPTLLSRIKTLTDKPVTHIINTHSHADHVGSNQFFSATVEIVSHHNAARQMVARAAAVSAGDQRGLPDQTFTQSVTLLDGPDAIDLRFYGAAHTSGDAFVIFRRARVMHAGDVFGSRAYPTIDAMNGGSSLAYADTLAKAARDIQNVDKVVTGHGPMASWQEFLDYGEFNRAVLAHARAAFKEGRTPEQALTEINLPAKFKDYNLRPRGGPGGVFQIFYDELAR